MNAIQFREFSKSDWDGFAGAESFQDDQAPRIASIEVRHSMGAAHQRATVVVDAEGVSIVFHDGTEVFVSEKREVILALLALKPRMDIHELDELGFEPADG